MSQENVEVFRRAFEEFTRGGWEPLFGTVWAPEIVWDMSPAGIAGLGVYHGHDELWTCPVSVDMFRLGQRSNFLS